MAGYKCPKCGQEDGFVASEIWATFTNCRIDELGWDYINGDGYLDLPEHAKLACVECGYEGQWKEFDPVYRRD